MLAIVAAVAMPAGGAARGPMQEDRATVAADLLASLDAKPTPRRRIVATRTLDRLGVHPIDGESGKPAADGDPPYRGRVLGPGYQRGWLDAGAEMKLEQQFLAGQRATIAVAGAPTAPLVLTVVEPGEQPVCREAPRACRWLPLYTQRYAITLRNAGGARVRYYLVLD